MDKREAITASNLGPVVSLLAWIMVASVLIAVGIKFTLSSVILRRWITEDIALALATVFSIGFSVSISLAVPNGIGRHQTTLSSDQLKSLQKAVYSASILLVLVSSCAQASILIFLYEITPRLSHQRLIYSVAGFTALFFIPSFFVAVFPCRPPDVWEVLGSQCIDQSFFWRTFAGVNLVIESALILLPAFMVWPMTMDRRRKSIVITGFAARLAVMGAFAAQFYEAQSLETQLLDKTFDTWRYHVTTVFVQGLSIITVCIPYIRNLLLGMESGMIQTGHFRLPDRHGLEPEIPLRLNSLNNTGAKIA
ncbi:uncharacterized protein LY89DRAFT_75073 [Mollisia scopiformis]|uniref:Rhodopsin domain-containing protein n=1 Tax=Mollisia scopiformis TaxID=149040 RepID=A0A194X7G2_MOLSC|nr:uncharacterized protein LY89DRAFT_75073 [Mollisia scopiformis]KUJ16113.1 hypothetical protein LY89DRAFT_75073 [Mollisia scopiformis]